MDWVGDRLVEADSEGDWEGETEPKGVREGDDKADVVGVRVSSADCVPGAVGEVELEGEPVGLRIPDTEAVSEGMMV